MTDQKETEPKLESKKLKSEFEEFVKQVFATYNQTLFEVDKKSVLRAWWSLLKDINVDDLYIVLNEISLTSKFMPTPGMIRRHYKDSQIADMPPSPQEAWVILQSIIRKISSGVEPSSVPQHPTVVETIKSLGDTALSLSTNGDREYFMEAYERNRMRFLTEAYKVES